MGRVSAGVMESSEGNGGDGCTGCDCADRHSMVRLAMVTMGGEGSSVEEPVVSVCGALGSAPSMEKTWLKW